MLRKLLLKILQPCWQRKRIVTPCGEESAGASFLRQDATVWTTDKDGILP